MAERRTIGQILLGAGRITEEEMARALEHQRDHGGYFGEALLACGFVRREELEWGLATQFDIPYVFPEAGAVDPEAAALVAPEWALAHLTLPIALTPDGVTVVVESPTDTGPVEALEARTGLPVRRALSPAPLIRDLIRSVYGREAVPADEDAPTVELEEALARALEASAERFGISTRQHTSWFWWEEAGTMRRRVLEGIWRTDLDELLIPPPGERVEGRPRATWAGQVKRRGMVTPVEVRYLSGDAGHEYVFRPARKRARVQERFDAPPAGLLSEVRLLARSGAARFVVTGDPTPLGHEILPSLPALLLDPSWRSVHVHAGSRAEASEAFSLKMPRDPGSWTDELELLRAFHFDAVTVDLAGSEEAWAASALDVASVAFLLWPPDLEPRGAYDAGIRWHLRIAREPGGELAWSLDPLHA